MAKKIKWMLMVLLVAVLCLLECTGCVNNDEVPGEEEHKTAAGEEKKADEDTARPRPDPWPPKPEPDPIPEPEPDPEPDPEPWPESDFNGLPGASSV